MQSTNEIVIAAAGGGKTTRIARHALADGRRCALITYTQNNTGELNRRLYADSTVAPAGIEVWSWYTFLLREMARPYQNFMHDTRIDGIDWVNSQSTRFEKKSNTSRFFFHDGSQVYSDKLAQFICECNDRSKGRIIKRLEDRFETIYVDEVQDLAGYDLDLIELLFRSSIRIVLVGDHRQSIYKTNNSLRHKAYGGAKIIEKFREWEKRKLVSVRYETESYRCGPEIVALADMFFPGEPKTVSRNDKTTGHDGVFFLPPTEVDEYVHKFNPQVLRLDRRTDCADYDAMNFGESKGLTFDRVLIFPHGKCRDWLKSGKISFVLPSAPRMYVGVTRARYSVAFVYDGTVRVDRIKRYLATDLSPSHPPP